MPPNNETKVNEIENGDRILNDQTEAIRSKYQLQHLRGKFLDKCPSCNKAMELGTEAVHRIQCAEQIAARRSQQTRRQTAQKERKITKRMEETRLKLSLIGQE